MISARVPTIQRAPGQRSPEHRRAACVHVGAREWPGKGVTRLDGVSEGPS